MAYTPDELHDLMLPNPADDVPLPWRVHIEVLRSEGWRKAHGPFQTEVSALAHLQEYLHWHTGDRVRIGTRLYEVRADGLYTMSARRGWQKFEGVQS